MINLTILSPVAANLRGIDVERDDLLICAVAADPGEPEPPAHGFKSIERLEAFIAGHKPDAITVEGSEGEDVGWIRRALGMGH